MTRSLDVKTVCHGVISPRSWPGFNSKNRNGSSYRQQRREHSNYKQVAFMIYLISLRIAVQTNLWSNEVTLYQKTCAAYKLRSTLQALFENCQYLPAGVPYCCFERALRKHSFCAWPAQNDVECDTKCNSFEQMWEKSVEWRCSECPAKEKWWQLLQQRHHCAQAHPGRYVTAANVSQSILQDLPAWTIGAETQDERRGLTLSQAFTSKSTTSTCSRPVRMYSYHGKGRVVWGKLVG